jgi:hypothetical protein
VVMLIFLAKRFGLVFSAKHKQITLNEQAAVSLKEQLWGLLRNSVLGRCRAHVDTCRGQN